MKFDKNIVTPAVLIVAAIATLVLITIFADDPTSTNAAPEPAQSGQY